MIDGSIVRACTRVAGALLAGVCCTGALAQAGGVVFVERPGHTEFSGRMIARARTDIGAERQGAAWQRVAPLVMARADETGEWLLSVPAIATVEGQEPVRGAGENALAARLMATGDYEYVTPDWRCWPQVIGTNDPWLSLQWHHTKLNSRAAWDISTGSPGITVAFVDTGIDVGHPDLAGARVSGYNSASHLAETAGGQVNDIVGHGTHVAGCGAAIGNNGIGVSGMGWSLRLMMVRTTNDSWGTAFVWDICEGARWAADHGARIVSVSYAGVETPSVQTTGAYIRSKDSLLLFAADNTSSNHTTFDWPDVLVVGAVDQNDAIGWFSSYGPAVDVFAPGVGIYSTKRWGSYEYRDGTSFATPIVAGLAGIAWSINPSFTSQQIESFITGACVDLGAPGNDATFGWGRVDAFGTVKLAQGAMGPQAPTALADSAQTWGGVPILIDVLGNDYDVNGDAFSLSLLTEWSARGATISRSRGTGPGGRDQVHYSPPAALSGVDTFQYRSVDTTGRMSVGTVTVDVQPHCLSDVNFSGYANAEDFDVFMGWFEAQDRRADLNRDGFVNGNDFDYFMIAYIAGC